MKRGRPAFTEQRDRPRCSCGKPCAINYYSKEGYVLYKSKCGKCIKFPYRRKKKPQCEHCGFQGDPCQLDVHHKDRNKKNNDIENLETLCANCHRLEHKGEFAFFTSTAQRT